MRQKKEQGDQMKVIADVQMKTNVTATATATVVVAMAMEKSWCFLEVKPRELAVGLDMGAVREKRNQERGLPFVLR